jgi:hypothetical protein
MIKYFLSYRMNDIDALTLKLLTSKKKYNAYLETVEPDKSAEIQDYCNAVKTNKRRIISLFESYLDDPEKQTMNELDDAIESCLKEFLKYFEVRDREDKSAKNNYDETDESDEGSDSCEKTSEGSDSCFATKATKAKKATKEHDESDDESEEIVETKKQSFWGKTIMKGAF